jgi:transposase
MRCNRRAYAEADPIARVLETMVGIGPVRALTIRAEIGDIARFRRGGPELASYAGLVPRVEASADHCCYGRITREGSPWLRFRHHAIAAPLQGHGFGRSKTATNGMPPNAAR